MHVAIETHRSRWSPEHRYVSAREWKHGCSHAHFFMFTSLNVNFMLTLLEHAHMLDCRALFDMEEAFQHEGVVAGGGDVDVLWTRTNVRFYGMLTLVENAHMFNATACCRSLNMHTCWIVVHMLNHFYMLTWIPWMCTHHTASLSRLGGDLLLR